VAVVVWACVDVMTSCGAEVVTTWELVGQGVPDLAAVELLARWQLSARRAGASIRLRDVNADLDVLLGLAGLRREMGVGSLTQEPGSCASSPSWDSTRPDESR